MLFKSVLSSTVREALSTESWAESLNFTQAESSGMGSDYVKRQSCWVC